MREEYFAGCVCLNPFFLRICLNIYYFQLFLDKINLLNSEIENEKTLLRQETDSWIENWVFDMEQIIKLYELPYT